MSLLTRAETDDLPCTIGGTCPGRGPRGPWTTAHVTGWVRQTIAHYLDPVDSRDGLPLYRQWSLADICRVRSYHAWGWYSHYFDSPECWAMRLALLREELRRRGDSRAEEECPAPAWLSDPESLAP